MPSHDDWMIMKYALRHAYMVVEGGRQEYIKKTILAPR